MTINCGTCIYFGKTYSTCRAKSPVPLIAGGQTHQTVVWPIVDPVNDWCGEGYNPTDGWYDKAATPAPADVQVPATVAGARKKL